MPEVTLEQILQSAHDLYNQGFLGQAQSICSQVIALKPDVIPALILLALIDIREGRVAAAAANARRAVEIAPGSAPAHAALGEALRLLRDIPNALAHLQQAVAIDPDFPDTHRSLGICYAISGKLDESMEEFQTVIRLTPRDASAHNNLANTLLVQKHYAQAEQSYRRALALKPGFVEAQTNLAVALAEQLNLQDAEREYRKAIQLQPNYFHAYLMLGGLQQAAGRVEEAVQTWELARQLHPDEPVVHSLRLNALNLTDTVTPEDRFKEATAYAEKFETPYVKAHLPLADAPAPRERLRIGLVSTDFCTHPVTSFLNAALALDRNRFDIICISNTSKPDLITESIKSRSDFWIDIRSIGDDQAAHAIREARVDVLVDLSGHTADNRLPIFFRRPAPLQVSWLGYPSTTGLRSIDYRITDANADPLGMTEQLHSEKLFRLDQTFLCFNEPPDSPPVAPPPAEKATRITFGVFAVLPKIKNRMIQLWARILDQVPGSHIVLKNKLMASPDVRSRLLKEFADAGVSANRIEFLSRDASYSDYLSRYGSIDIMLDTYPYHGTTMLCEALWMGVPVVSLAGKSHLSRAAVTLLNNVQLTELIAADPRDYVAKAVALASDLPRLRQVRQNLRPIMRSSPLMNKHRFAQQLGDAFFAMWSEKCAKKEAPSM